MRKHSLLFTIVIASQLGATKCGQVLRDPGFDLWCGEQLCAWKLERGEVKRVPTWHEGDGGVELVGTDVAIEQLTPVNSGDDTCIKFDLVANVDENAEVYLDVDVQGDGSIEMHERIPTSHWEPLSYNIRVAPPYDGIRFELTKKGTGAAVLANIGANTAHDQCAGLTALDPGPRRDGAQCDPTMASQCASGICRGSATEVPASAFGLACAGCNPAAPSCGGTDVCGLGDAFSPVFAVPTQCVGTETKELGEKCITSAECASGGCFKLASDGMGVCSTCFADNQCGGTACAPAWERGPLVCGAGQHVGAAGAPCGADEDCASGHCNGTVRRECDDGRTCIDASQCPFESGLKNGPCTTVGVQGGTCQ
ncbi:MAG TPA: hypothetical protein VMZ53_05950 [Kofleriaceae bacterium]|nr:hypothetical protein [Kofleriaceae bacterium]